MSWLVLTLLLRALSLSRVMLSFLPLLVRFLGQGRKAIISAGAEERNGKGNSCSSIQSWWQSRQGLETAAQMPSLKAVGDARSHGSLD